MRQRGASPGPTPIPVQGDIQIFANQECTEYPTKDELYSTLYARVNVPWGFDEAWGILHVIDCYAPDDVFPEGFYDIMYIDEFFSADSSRPYTAGEVVALNANSPTLVPEGAQFVIVKPS